MLNREQMGRLVLLKANLSHWLPRMRNSTNSNKGMQVLFWILLVSFLTGYSTHMATGAQARCQGKHNAQIEPSQQPQDVHSWFAEYDSIRRHARMSLKEKLQSRHLVMMVFNPLALFSNEAQPLLERMIEKYSVAIEELGRLQPMEATAELQTGYLKYFQDAKELFVDISEAEDKTAEDRRKIVPVLIERKHRLEALDQKNKLLDARLRIKFDIAPLKG